MTAGTIVIGDWTNLDPQTMTNLYLYGQVDTPTSFGERLRSNEEIDSYPTNSATVKNLEVKIDMVSFMDTGPGRYAFASEASFVQDFFTGGVSLANGTYTKQDLIANHGYTLADFRIDVVHYETDPNSDDYALRTYVYNNAAFVISDATEFVINGDNIYINKMCIQALDDNFDFESSGSLTQIGDIFLESVIDPSSIGRRVEIEFINAENVPISSDRYTVENFLQDSIDAAAVPGGLLIPDAYSAVSDIIDDLNESGTIQYETDNGDVIYGTNANETINGTSGNDIIVSGTNSGGTDIINAGDGNDVIYSSNSIQGDTINGGNGSDTVDYSNIDLVYGSGGINSGNAWGWGGLANQNWDSVLPNGFASGVSIAISAHGVGADTFVSIENVTGTNGNDSISGDEYSNTIDGLGGMDHIHTTGVGPDTIVWHENQITGTWCDFDRDDTIQLAGFTTDVVKAIEIDGEYFYVWIDNGVLPTREQLVLHSISIQQTDLDGNVDANGVTFRNPNGTNVDIANLIIGDVGLLDAFQCSVGDDNFAGTDNDDFVNGNQGNDSITTGAGNDGLYGGAGNDLLNAGAGNDRVYAGIGDDTVSFILQENTLTSDHYFGNQGVDHLDLYFNSSELTSGIRSSLISFRNFLANPTNIDDDATGGGTFDFAFDLSVSRFETFTLFVNNVATQMSINARNDMFFGSVNVPITGNFLVDNGGGADTGFIDTIFANAGTFATTHGGSVVISANGNFTYTPPVGFSGIDSYIYTANDGQGTTGTATAEFGVGLPGVVAGTSASQTLTGTSGNDTMYGLGGNDTLNGNDGNDTLNGGTGVDTMVGGIGNDIYIVDSSGDSVTEGSSAGTDTVQASINYTLGSNVENLTLTGSGNLTGTGNSLVNIITGNSGNNTLDGGSGIDTLIGGIGNDIFIVDNTSEVVTEAGGQGTDEVRSSATYTLSANIENLTLTGSGNIGGTGNTIANTIVGNSGDNALSGGGGNDTLDGGSAGSDTLTGGTGDDTFIVNSTGDSVVELAAEGTDIVFSSSSTHTLSSNVENITLTGASNIAAIGNTLDNIMIGNTGNNTLTGNDGNDSLDGGAGNDSMIGGIGNDAYYVDSSSDTITEAVGAGTDTVNSTAATFALATNVENLVLTGTANINGTGNTLNNTITGNSGINTIDGGTGTDTMIGGAGDDTYTVDNVGDIITENLNEGNDLVLSYVTYTLATNVDYLALLGSTNINATGNALNNSIAGNSGANIIIGGDGDDYMDGGAGIDNIAGGLGNDIYVEIPSKLTTNFRGKVTTQS
ncbi:Ca2+-binding protein, RTX toxin-related [Chryseolinea serpens]|uniref:Ca2+-binding protein, RTX toxin-related n=1 Tax=Chryseolinea serpens TaxID=947013 RepID=A0A1M5PDN4_9BACT|nr:Ig-like domain-containing protein [Chryseolinea serpens]SHG99599.1 Ca2+-binding protein, RTX toxin-related [Chryseolinea serpens]